MVLGKLYFTKPLLPWWKDCDNTGLRVVGMVQIIPALNSIKWKPQSMLVSSEISAKPCWLLELGCNTELNLWPWLSQVLQSFIKVLHNNLECKPITTQLKCCLSINYSETHTLDQSGIQHDQERNIYLLLTWDVCKDREDLILKGPGHSIQQTLNTTHLIQTYASMWTLWLFLIGQ